ncbi:MAG: hypothetical protein H6679_03370 [Epsilonproteobacteria bacterium]|nr:hypothetical protein [Campylobacterota bacterium]
MKVNKTLIITLFCSLAAGMFFFLIQNGIILVHCSLPPSKDFALQTSVCTKKNIICSIWKDGHYLDEEQSVIWNKQDSAANLGQIVRTWLGILFEYHVIGQEINLEAVMLSSFEHEAYISLAHSFIESEQSVLDKWCTIQSLLKTLQTADLPAQTIQLLVGGSPLQDEHIDFSQPLCIQNYIEDKDLPL